MACHKIQSIGIKNDRNIRMFQYIIQDVKLLCFHADAGTYCNHISPRKQVFKFSLPVGMDAAYHCFRDRLKKGGLIVFVCVDANITGSASIRCTCT